MNPSGFVGNNLNQSGLDNDFDEDKSDFDQDMKSHNDIAQDFL